ncbi:MAG: hypothetical protein ACJAT4_002639 [Granulosicoccus sp.]|jgi:hypothetical protein
MRKKFEKKILATLNTIEGNGTFATSGVHKFIPPGLQIKGIGEVGFPLNPIQIKAMIQVAKKAPFGKGMETITDTAVRSAWEIDANQLTFNHKDWKKFLEKILKKVKRGLGLEEKKINASLYKLLIYETDDFFLPHKDSEKEVGMFGTMVIGLPAPHTGGELAVRFGEQETIINFSSAASNYKIPYSAFFADCEHEIKPITSGYRVGLVYNLLQSEKSKKIKPTQFSSQAETIAKLLKATPVNRDELPMIFLLKHQYTPTNFSLTHLKHHDRPRAEALLQAAEKAGYFAKLGLMTYHLEGELEGVGYGEDGYGKGRYGAYKEPDLSEGTMGEIYDSSLSINNWANDGFPGLGELNIDKEDIVNPFEENDDPIEQDAEGFTGNAGMTLEYWYHYGAIILWPKNSHVDILLQKTVGVRLAWLDYYVQHWKDGKSAAPSIVKLLLNSLKKEDWDARRYYNHDLSSVSTALIKLNDEKFIQENGTHFLVAIFKLIKVENWVSLFQYFSPDLFTPIFSKAATTDKSSVTLHLMLIMKALDKLKNVAIDTFVLYHLEQLPQYLSNLKLFKTQNDTYSYYSPNEPDFEKTSKTIIQLILDLSKHKNEDKKWIKNVHQQITKELTRPFVNEILTPSLLSKKNQDKHLNNSLYLTVTEDFISRTTTKPTPPKTWERAFPKKFNSHHQKEWNALRSFLASPTKKVFNYTQNQSERDSMTSAIRNVTIDLAMTTIKKGRPYTLRITKTQSAFEKRLKHWEKDITLLGNIKKLRNAN